MFALPSSRITHTQGHDPSTRPGRRATASAVVVGAAAIALLTFAHTSADAAENSSQTALEQHACAAVLGLDPSGRRYDTCIRTLDRSLAEQNQARLVQSRRSACGQRALQPGTPAFAVCVLTAEESR